MGQTCIRGCMGKIISRKKWQFFYVGTILNRDPTVTGEKKKRNGEERKKERGREEKEKEKEEEKGVDEGEGKGKRGRIKFCSLLILDHSICHFLSLSWV